MVNISRAIKSDAVKIAPVSAIDLGSDNKKTSDLRLITGLNHFQQ